MNRGLKIFLAKILFHFRIFELKKIMSQRRHIILAFHRVRSQNAQLNDFDSCPTIDIDFFQNIVKYIKQNYYITSLYELCNNLNLNKKLAAITFDDGWLDNYTNAYPVLKKFGIPATIFVTTGKINSSTPFWQGILGECFRKFCYKENNEEKDDFLKKIGKNEKFEINRVNYYKIVNNWKKTEV